MFAETDDMEYEVVISEKMWKVNELLIDLFVGMDHCISERGENLYVEVPRKDVESVISALKEHFRDVVSIKKAYSMIEDLHDFILVKPMVSEAPLELFEDVPCPSLEKSLVDLAADKEFKHLLDDQLSFAFQHAFETYDINTSRMLRYANRKGEKEEIEARIGMIDMERVHTVKSIQSYFASQPVSKAWLFGSFSRMEERPDSDIDILVSLLPGSHVGLVKYSEMILDLEQLLSRKVDLVAEGSIKPFAKDNINKEKVLVYART